MKLAASISSFLFSSGMLDTQSKQLHALCKSLSQPVLPPRSRMPPWSCCLQQWSSLQFCCRPPQQPVVSLPSMATQLWQGIQNHSPGNVRWVSSCPALCVPHLLASCSSCHSGLSQMLLSRQCQMRVWLLYLNDPAAVVNALVNSAA